VQNRTMIGVATVVVATSAVLGAGVAGALTHAVRHSGSSYGSLPRYLPRSSLGADTLLTGTVSRPALTSQGDPVKVILRHGSALVTVSGPVVPGEGLPFQAAADTATWTVTVTHVSAPVPISLSSFSTIDEDGKVYHDLSFVPGQPRPPAFVTPGRTASFELRVVMRTGEGMMRWAPYHNDLLATWDFVVEND
jgi:hypothetical protein